MSSKDGLDWNGLHRTLRRQLQKLGVSGPDDPPPTGAEWHELLARISRVYVGADDDRYTLERSLEVSSREMQELHASLAEERDRVRSALAERQAILDGIADGLVALDRAAVVRIANPALSELFAFSEPIVGRAAVEVLPIGLADILADAVALRSPLRRELQLPGERRFSLVTAAPIVSRDGEVESVVAIVRDVTLEREIDRMKTDFIATVSHELRTPLTSILGFAKITKKQLEERVFPHASGDDPRLRRAVETSRSNLDIVVHEGARLTALIGDVLDISKMESGRMEWKKVPFEAGVLVERATAACAALFAERPTELRREVEQGLPSLVGDVDRLMQVLINLISNAAKFTPRGYVLVSARKVDGGVELSVRDTGEGIAPVNHDAIFEKFRQVGDTLTGKPMGTGLGLPICRQIVHAHGSEIRVESALGEGSRFWFVLPV